MDNMLLKIILAPVVSYGITVICYAFLATILSKPLSGTIEQEFYIVSNILTTYVLCCCIVKKLTKSKKSS